jgi:hypothetical protein
MKFFWVYIKFLANSVKYIKKHLIFGSKMKLKEIPTREDHETDGGSRWYTKNCNSNCPYYSKLSRKIEVCGKGKDFRYLVRDQNQKLKSCGLKRNSQVGDSMRYIDDVIDGRI